MRKLISGCFLFLCLRSFSQTINADKPETNSVAVKNVFTESGTPFVETKFVRFVSGSPFFIEKKLQGVLITTNGLEYRNIGIRLNLMDSQVNFFNSNQEEFIVGVPLREVVLWDTVNHKNYHFILSDYIETTDKPEKGFYQLLQEGNAELYEQYKKTVKESRAFNSATFEESIETTQTYFLLLNGQWIKINKIKNLPSLLSDKKNEVQEYINTKRLSGYKQEDIESVIKYYNSLFEDKH